MAWHRRSYRHQARPLTEQERTLLGPFVPPALLERVRIAEVARIGTLLGWAGRRGWLGAALCMGPAGLTLGDLVVLESGLTGERRDRVLVHELVHVVQFDVLGTRRFVAEYVGGWVGCGLRYLSIPLEVDAVELSGRAAHGPFNLVGEVRGRLGA